MEEQLYIATQATVYTVPLGKVVVEWLAEQLSGTKRCMVYKWFVICVSGYTMVIVLHLQLTTEHLSCNHLQASLYSTKVYMYMRFS